jgi:hypothetical protein
MHIITFFLRGIKLRKEDSKMPMPRVINVAHPNLILETLGDLCKERGYKFESTPKELFPHNEWQEVHCYIETPEMWMGFSVQQHPGCCAILDLSYVKVKPWSQGNFDFAMQTVEEAAFNAGFAAVMMTQVVPAYSKMLWKHEPWIQGLDRGWQATVPPMRNAKSGNLVTILLKDLEQVGKRQGFEFPVNNEEAHTAYVKAIDSLRLQSQRGLSQ